MPTEVFLPCTTLQQASRKEIEDSICVLIQDTIVGDASRIEETIAQIGPAKKHDLELIAQVIVSKSLDEPQYCKACVSLAGALQLLLPRLPVTGKRGKKEETFMHALLDVFQTEFEAVCLAPAEQTFSKEEEQSGPAYGGNQNRIRAIMHLAGHLHCQGLLGKGVVKAMVQELVDVGHTEAANEVLWFIGTVANKVEQHQHLGTVLEDTGDSDGTSSESISLKDFKACSSERRPSLP